MQCLTRIEMKPENALSLADELIFAKTGKHLNTLQAAIFKASWLDAKYEQIAEECYCSTTHVRVSGAELWDSLSQALGEKVGKKSFRAALERYSAIAQKNRRSEPLQPIASNPKQSKPQIDPSQIELQSSYRDEPLGSRLALEELEFPKGQVKLSSRFYIERYVPLAESKQRLEPHVLASQPQSSIEWECFQAIIEPGAIVQIEAPRQMGKTSLMTRILHYAHNFGYQTVFIDLQLADSHILHNLDDFLRWMCLYLTKKLDLEERLDDYWDASIGSKVSCQEYLERYLLANLTQPLVIGLDRVEKIFGNAELAHNFIGLLQVWEETNKNSRVWQKLRLVLAHSTEAYIHLNLNQSPLNIGLPIRLPEFNFSQIQDLAHRHGINWNATQARQLRSFIGGNPYLVRMTLYYLKKKQLSLNLLLQQPLSEIGFYQNHLRRHLFNLIKYPDLASAYSQVVHSALSVQLDSQTTFKLNSMGLIEIHRGQIFPKCELFRQYFRDRLKPVD